jgi:hypothetical protein
MIARRTPLKRYTSVRKKRPGVRKGQPTNEEKTVERDRVYDRCGGRCELRGENGQPLHPNHLEGVLPSEGPLMARWHLVHVFGKRRWGWTERPGSKQRLMGGCYWCHIVGQHSLGRKFVVPNM